MFFQKIYNFLIHSRSVLLFAFVVETAIAGTIPAQKGSLYKTDWRFIQESISKMKLDENWPQKQQALQAYATSYVQSKKNKNYETSLDKGIRFYTNYDKLAQILSNGDKRLYKLLLANQNAFDNLVILSLSKHKTLENSFKRIKNAQAMEWVIIFSLLGIIGINNLRKYHYLNDLHEDLLNHYTKFFATFYVILFAYLTYLFAGPATLGSPRRVCAGLQKTLAKEATNKYHENFFY